MSALRPPATPVVVVAAILLGGCGGGEGAQGKLVVRSQVAADGRPALIVSVDGRVARQPQLATSSARVGVVCTDRRGRTTVAGRHPWPFLTEPGFPLPHVHQPATRDQIARTSRCRLTGTRMPIHGDVPR